MNNGLEPTKADVLREALNAIVDRAPERDAKWAGMTARDIAIYALASTPIAPVQDDDAEYLVRAVQHARTHNIAFVLMAPERAERIADRLSRQAGGMK